MKGQLHLSPEGPTVCRAESGKCPYEAGGHYDDESTADVAFANSMGGALPESLSKTETMELKLDFDSVTVKDGDLSEPKTRFYFANGLCGDLANAIRSVDPERKLYFSLDVNQNGRPNAEDLNSMNSLEDLSEFVFHAFVESKHQPGKFLDSYGVKSGEEIEEFFGGPLVEVPTHIFQEFHSGESHDLSNFARAAMELDRTGMSYEYSDFPED